MAGLGSLLVRGGTTVLTSPGLRKAVVGGGKLVGGALAFEGVSDIINGETPLSGLTTAIGLSGGSSPSVEDDVRAYWELRKKAGLQLSAEEAEATRKQMEEVEARLTSALPAGQRPWETASAGGAPGGAPSSADSGSMGELRTRCRKLVRDAILVRHALVDGSITVEEVLVELVPALRRLMSEGDDVLLFVNEMRADAANDGY